MQRISLLLLVLVVIPFVVSAQSVTEGSSEYKAGDFFIGISSGVDINMNAYRTPETNGFKFEKKGPRYNFGFDLGVMATKRLRPRFEMKYVRVAYGQDWPGSSTGGTTYEYTTTKVNYLDLNMHLDYLLWGAKSNLKVFLSPGIKTEYSMGARYRTTKSDGDHTKKKFNVLDEYFPHSIAGAACSMIFKYDLNENMGITFTPEYTKFFRPFQYVNTNKYQRLSFNVGIELRIH